MTITEHPGARPRQRPGRADDRAAARPLGPAVVVLDGRPERDLVGSKAICQQRDVLDVWDSVGAGAEIAAEGVTWTTARTFHRDRRAVQLTVRRPRAARRSRRS